MVGRVCTLGTSCLQSQVAGIQTQASLPIAIIIIKWAEF